LKECEHPFALPLYIQKKERVSGKPERKAQRITPERNGVNFQKSNTWTFAAISKDVKPEERQAKRPPTPYL
jgi:hypothetical protein